VRHYAQMTEVFFAGWRPGSPVAEKNYNPEYGAQDFLGSMTVLGLLADFVLPLWWAVGATIPIIYASWWIAYRSGWFE